MGMGFRLFAVAFAIVSSTHAISEASNLIEDTYGGGAGSFEQGDFVANFWPPGAPHGVSRLASSSTAITGWTVGGAPGVDWLPFPDHRAIEGTKSLDLKGANVSGDGSISTIIPTIAGKVYRITFEAYGGLNTQSGTVSAGSLVQQVFTAPGVPAAATAAYSPFAFDFTATSASTTLTLQSLNSDGFGPVIDDVSVALVPEPAMLSLLALGGLAVVRRRRAQSR